MAIFRSLARRVKRWIGRGLAAALQKLYDGPRHTDRLRGFVLEFMYFYPHATRGEWMVFAFKLGEEMHNTGVKRGYEQGLAHARGLPPPPDDQYTWTWDTGHATTADVQMAMTVPEEDPELPGGMSADEQARWYAWRLHDEMTRIGHQGKV